MNTSVFDSTIPSVFIIGSPFQALCLVGAIRNLKLTDYKVIVIRYDRHMQVKNVLDKFRIEYEVRYVGRYRWRMRWYRITSLIHRQNKYKRLFLGDYRSQTLLYFGLQVVSDGADIVYLDDGNATIPLFDDKRTSPPLGGLDTICAQLITRFRQISFMKYFYSVYSDLPNPKYEIGYNSLSVLVNSKNNKEKSNVFIIGTNTKLYCESMNVSEQTLLNVLESTLKSIKDKYAERGVVYIPHGKDKSINVKKLCETYKVRYQILDVPVELYFIDEPQPVAIYGFMSSALYNLKQLFPSTDVYNLYLTPTGGGDTIARKESIANYYKNSGIEQLDF